MEFESYIAEIVAQRRQGKSYPAIAKSLEKQYGKVVGEDAVRKMYNKYQHLDTVGAVVGDIKVLKENARTKRSNSLTARENRTILDYLTKFDEIVEGIDDLTSRLAGLEFLPCVAPVLPAKDKSKRNLTVEALISDVHIGKQSKDFNLEVCIRRLRHYRTVLLQEIERKSAHYNVDRIVLAFLGDNIENALIHGRESQMGCEFGNPEQVSHAIELFLTEIILPVAAIGIPVDIVGINGNHDREEPNKTYQLPGKNSLNWIIFQSLQGMTKHLNLKHMQWHVPEGSYQTLNIYGNNILYEHGDRVKGGFTNRGLLNHISSRSRQTGLIIHGLRIGHIHKGEILEDGLVVINPAVCGADSYSEEMAFTSTAGQMINYYVDSPNRENKYYHSFSVQLEHIK